MPKAPRVAAAPLLCGLPYDILVWEIFVRLPPKTLLRCRAVCRAWRGTTSTRVFLLAHHARQPSLPIIPIFGSGGSHILAFNHRASAASDQLHTVARLDEDFYLAASCDGLIVLSDVSTETCFSIFNPATRQHAPIGRAPDMKILGMYPHRPTGEYRLLMQQGTQRRWMKAPKGQIGCYVLALGSGQPPRYLGLAETGSDLCFLTPVLVHDSLHWFRVQHKTERKLLIVFDTIAESFREMRLPILPTNSGIFEMDGTLGIYTRNTYSSEFVAIWVLQNYENEVWDLKYRIKLPVAEIRRRFKDHEYNCNVKAVSGNGGILLFIGFHSWMLCVTVLATSFSVRVAKACVFLIFGSNKLLFLILLYGNRRSYCERSAFQLMDVE